MNIPSWIFALLRFGMITLIYMHFAPKMDHMFEQPVMYYGLPFFLLLATLGIHRYWMFALGTLLLCASFAELTPASLEMSQFKYFSLGLVTFFLGFTPCDRDWSVRAMWNQGKEDFGDFQAAPVLTWNIYRVLVSLFYARFLVTKASPSYFEGNYFSRNLLYEFWASDFVLQPWFQKLCAGVAVVMFVLNVGFIFAVWIPKHYRSFVLAAVGFHTVYLVTTQFGQMIQFLFLLMLLPFAAYGQTQTRPSNVFTPT